MGRNENTKRMIQKSIKRHNVLRISNSPLNRSHLFLALWLIVAGITGTGCQNRQPLEKPNILFIFTDDQKFNTIGALGNPDIHTPHLDKLADGAFVFTNAYCMGGNSGAVCIPSRNMVMSGRDFFRFNADARIHKENNIPRRAAHYTNPEWPSLPRAMHSAGYETFFREKSGSANNPDVREHFEHRKDIDMVAALRTGRPAEGIVDQAVAFLTQERDTTRPFFMYLGFPCPHDPRWSLKKFRDLYDPADLPLPPNYLPVHPWDIGDMTIRDECLESWPRTEEAIRRHLHDYYSVISSMDYDIGRLHKALEKLGLLKNTIILFSSDQGIAIGDHGLMGKQNVYEGTLKVPFFIKGPGIKEGTSDALVYLHDIFPTFCEYAHAEIPSGFGEAQWVPDIPEKLDGVSLKDIISGKEKAVRPSLLLAYKDYQRAIRDDRWKLIRFPKIDKTLLFDLENDPFEKHNLANEEEYSEKVNEMLQKLEQACQEAGDTIDLFPEETLPAAFDYPKEKLSTPFPAGGLAPGDPHYKKNNKS